MPVQVQVTGTCLGTCPGDVLGDAASFFVDVGASVIGGISSGFGLW